MDSLFKPRDIKNIHGINKKDKFGCYETTQEINAEYSMQNFSKTTETIIFKVNVLLQNLPIQYIHVNWFICFLEI